MKINDVFDMFREDLDRVEAWMEKALQSDVDLIPQISRHLIGSGGKRFRPLLLLSTAALCGYTGERRYPLAAVIEFIHTATLLHDDVIDHAQTRRGKVSANNVWGNAASVLVGDYLYSKAFKLMAEHGNLAVIKLLAETTNVMSEGEVFQLVKCGDVALTEGDYMRIIEQKTAYLIAAACAIGALLAGAPSRQVKILRRFGGLLGSAFQMIDDTLDYVAKEEAFGKAIGKDLDEGKLTLPLIRTLSLCEEGERADVISILQNHERDEGAVRRILALIERYNGISYAMERAESYIVEGKGLLDTFPDSPGRKALSAIADFVISRKI